MPQVFTLYLEMMRTGLYDVVFCFVFCFVFWEGFGVFLPPLKWDRHVESIGLSQMLPVWDLVIQFV